MLDLETPYSLESYGFLDPSSFQYLKDLYLPIISHDAFFLYIYLVELIRDKEMMSGHYGNLIVASTLSQQDFILAKQSLEAVGLMTTLKNKSTNDLKFIVADPLTPKKFFVNLSLAGLLAQTVGVKRYNKIVAKYTYNNDRKGYEDISAKFNENYTLDFKLSDIEASEKANLLGRNLNVLRDNFDDMKLFANLSKNHQIKVSALSEEEVAYIHHIGSLYGMNEKMLAALTADNYEPKASYGNRVNRESLKKGAEIYVKTFKVADIKVQKKTNISGDSEVAQKIRYYESISPREFLKNAQKGVDVVSSDMNLLEDLSLEFRMSNGMINCLIDYVLKAKNGDLNRNYVKKIASSLIRKDCHDTLDVMNALYGKTSKLAKEEDKVLDVDSAKEDDKTTKVDELDDLEGIDELLGI